jgi:5-hydroxyisourate hydrolase
MTGRLTTHVLDTHRGRPAAGLTIELWHLLPQPVLLKTVMTNEDGRVSEPLLSEKTMQAGTYELRFHAGDYLKRSGAVMGDLLFLDVVPIRFGIADAAQHYHVPLLLSAHGYGTYRGS